MSPPSALEPSQALVRVVKPEGNNLYTCELPNKKPILLELAQRFRNTIWIRRGGIVLAERYSDNSEETRAVGEIVNVVRDEKLWRKQSYWYVEPFDWLRSDILTCCSFQATGVLQKRLRYQRRRRRLECRKDATE